MTARAVDQHGAPAGPAAHGCSAATRSARRSSRRTSSSWPSVFAYPLGLRGLDVLPRLLLRRAGRDVDRPVRRARQLRDGAHRPGRPPGVRATSLVFLVINVPLTVVLSLVLATALNAAIRLRTFFRVSYYVPYVTASVAVVGVWLFLFNSDGLVNHAARPAGAGPVLAGQLEPRDADGRAVRDLEAARLLHPALPGRAAERAQGPVRVGVGRRRRPAAAVLVGDRARRAAGHHPGGHPRTITGANLFTEPYLLTGGGGPDGASASPVLLMYQRGIEQGHPDSASAIGVLLVVGVLAGLAAQTDGDPGAGAERALTSEAAPDQPGSSPLLAGALRVPVPLLLHGDRLAAGRAGHARSAGAFPNRAT